MLSSADFVRHSLELHLFFARIMKEHSFFIEAGFTPKDKDFIQRADAFRRKFDRFLEEVVVLSNGIARPSVLQSGEVITQFTLSAESATAYFTGVDIPTGITEAEAGLSSGEVIVITPALEQRVFELNERVIVLLNGLIEFKTKVLNDVLACRIFTFNYPLLIDHLLREAKFYLLMVQRLQSREIVDIERDALEQEVFWNRIMAEHSKFIRGLLDPTEDDLINTANNFGREFDVLTEEAKLAMDRSISVTRVTAESLNATANLRNFKAQGTQGVLECRIKSIIIPLLGDHVLREASHYLRLLKTFGR